MNVGEALGAALKGAAAGMALGPIGAVAGGIGGLVLDLAPELGKWIFGSKAEATIAAVTQAVAGVSGTSDAVAATQTIAADPSLRMQLRVQLAKIAADRQAEADAAHNAELSAWLADVGNARATYVATRDATVPRLAYFTTAATYICTGGFVLALVLVRGIPESAIAVISMVIGHLWTAYGNVNGFYFGSSNGSERKTDIIAGQLSSTTTTTVTAPPDPPVTTTTTTDGPAPTPEVVPPAIPFPDWDPLDFDVAFAGIIGVEGGYVDDPHDPGRATNFGISAHAHPGLDIKGMTIEKAKAIYLAEYWTPLKIEKLHPTVAYELFDFAVNSGVSQAVKCLQKVVGTNPDGIVGYETTTRTAFAVHKQGADAVSAAFMAERLRFLRSLPTWPRYARGWTARVDAVEKKAETV